MSMSEQDSHVTDAAERMISEFEQAWLAATPPSIVSLVDELLSRETLSEPLLAELCIVDLEFRWQQEIVTAVSHDELGSRPKLRDYKTLLGLQSPLAFEVHHLAEEYRIRSIWGDKPTPDQFLSEFSMPNPALLQAIKEVDKQLTSDDAGADHFGTAKHVIPSDDPRAPLPFSDYVLHELVGAGGIGKVYRATQRSLERSVAVKTLAKSLQRDPIAVDRFVDEARALARLKHPSIVGVHGLGRYPGGGYFLVMDFVPGTTLEDVLGSTSLSRHQAIGIVAKLAEAMEYAHSQGVIHCDLKPSNILIADDNELFVSDFGFAELWQESHFFSLNNPGQRGGTLGYTAPEWLEDATTRPMPTIDVYSLGAILGELLCDDEVADQGIANACSKAMAVDPADRYQSASDFGDAIRSIQARRASE